MRVAEMPVSQQPVERLNIHGVTTLTTAELLTIALGLNDTVVADALLAEHSGSLRRLAMAPSHKLSSIPHIARQKIARLRAIFELGRRYTDEIVEEGVPIKSPLDVARYASARMEDLPVEEFHILCLDGQHKLKRDVRVTRGLINTTLVHPREVFHEAISERAVAIILVHNHPSGDPAPSEEDRRVTETLVAAGQLLEIPVHDHIIIGRGRYTSFAEAGLL